MHTPDPFDGRTFGSIEEGFRFAREAGFEANRERGAAAADDLASDLVYAGFSFGVMIAQRLAQTRPGARAALLMHSCVPVTEFGEVWPEGVPVQIHGNSSLDAYDPEAAALLMERCERSSPPSDPGGSGEWPCPRERGCVQ